MEGYKIIKDKHANRIEKKFCNLITENPWTIELDRNDYRLEQFKRKRPEIYQAYRNKILGDVDSLRVEVTLWWKIEHPDKRKH